MPTERSNFEFGGRRLLLKAALFVGLAILGAALSRLPDVREALGPAGRWTAYLKEHGVWTAPAFAIASGCLIMLGVPRLLFCPPAGAAFGFWLGLATSTVGTMIAYAGVFAWIRGRWTDAPQGPPSSPPAALRFLGRRPGFLAVILARLLPVPGLLATGSLALSGVRTRTYLLGSLAGLLPQAVPLVLLGAGVSDGNAFRTATAGCIALVGLGILISLARRRLRPSTEPATADPGGSRPDFS